MDKYQAIFKRAAECRIFLHIHGFLADSENDKVWTRINKYQKDLKIKEPKIKNPDKSRD